MISICCALVYVFVGFWDGENFHMCGIMLVLRAVKRVQEGLCVLGA